MTRRWVLFLFTIALCCGGCEFPFGETSLLKAVRNRDIEAIRKSIEKDPEQLNEQDILGFAPLHAAALSGRKDIVELLLVHGANIEVESVHKYRPLHEAARGGSFEVVLLLLQSGAKVDAQDVDNVTPLRLAVAGAGIDVVKLLLKYGADPTIKDKDNISPIDWAQRIHNDERVRLLTEADPEPQS